MKRCPTCNQQFTDEWLTFCTQDGTSLVEVETPATEPPPTVWRPPMPPSVSPTEQPTLDMPDRYQPPAPVSSPQSLQPAWLPPPPPAYPVVPQQSLAVASLVLGIISITLGWCCSFGILTAPVAIVMGIVALVQIKNDPMKYGGKGFAIGGLVTGGLYIVGFIAIMILYGIGILMGGLSNM